MMSKGGMQKMMRTMRHAAGDEMTMNTGVRSESNLFSGPSGVELWLYNCASPMNPLTEPIACAPDCPRLLCLSGLAWGQDYEREQRWADQILPSLMVGDAVWLEQKKGHKFLGAVHRGQERARRGDRRAWSRLEPRLRAVWDFAHQDGRAGLHHPGDPAARAGRRGQDRGLPAHLSRTRASASRSRPTFSRRRATRTSPSCRTAWARRWPTSI